jgi:hypothetical protein
MTVTVESPPNGAIPVIVAVPGATAVTRPDALTVATAGSAELHGSVGIGIADLTDRRTLVRSMACG